MSPGRLPRPAPAALDPDRRAVYDAVAGGPRAQGRQLFRLTDDDGGLEGPFNAFLLAPPLGMALQAVGSAVRYQTSLSDRAREIAILLVAVRRNSAFEWYAHEAVARHAGLSDAELAGLRQGRAEVLADVLADPVERAIADAVLAVLDRGDLDDAEYRRTVDALGLPQLFEVLTLIGYYDLLAMQMRVFRVEPPAG